MAVLDVIQSAATVTGLAIPSVVFSATDRTSITIANMVNACARQILEEYDWARLIKVATITGDGVATAFPLPEDYDRMVKDANLWGPSYTFYPAQQVSDFNRWLELQSYSVETWEPRWAVFGGNINVLPARESGDTLTYGYISNAIVNGTASTFTADSDTFVLDERLLRLSFIWNWKKAQGMDFSAEFAEYQEALERARFKDPGARQSIISGRGSYSWPTGQVFP
jgi:hypothetical protein